MDLGVWGFTAYVFADLGSETMALSASWLPTISELAGRGGSAQALDFDYSVVDGLPGLGPGV